MRRSFPLSFLPSSLSTLAARSALAFPLLAGLSLAACVAEGGDVDVGQTEGAVSVIDKTGDDVQTLQVWTPGKLFPNPPERWTAPAPSDVSLEAASGDSCATLSTREWSRWFDKDVDCTDAFVSKLAWPGAKKSPAFDTIRFQVSHDTQANVSYTDPDMCTLVELRTVTKDAALDSPTFAGIGFHTSRGPSFVAKADLHAVGHTTLKSGEAATVHRFVGISTCISGAHNSTSGNMYQTFAFKPYARFDLSPGEGDASFRVWESTADHRIGRSWPGATPVVNSNGFDRQDDLLQK
ncbi:MAG: hypothetical protein U0169_12880 [Polyangiaceae bacterium]